jgi:hypothetical protein
MADWVPWFPWLLQVRSSYKAGEFFLEAMIKGDRGEEATHHAA